MAHTELVSDPDLERRARLRSFLMYLRSQLGPDDFGMVRTGRRRVPGLRREEVAELVGVSEEWYKRYESGRASNVSPRFIARLADALRLNAFDQLALYQLSFPDLYRAGSAVALDLLPPLRSKPTMIGLASDIDDARRRLDRARDAFLQDETKELCAPPPRILKSWKRSRSHHVDASARAAPVILNTDDKLDEAREANDELVSAAGPVVRHLSSTLGSMGYVVCLADGLGRILEIGGDAETRRLVERVGVVPGADLSENVVGTSAIGTAIADRRPVQVTAGEHFAEGGQAFACTGSPIRDPTRGELTGALALMSNYKLVRAGLLPAVMRYAFEIEEELAKRNFARGDLPERRSSQCVPEASKSENAVSTAQIYLWRRVLRRALHSP